MSTVILTIVVFHTNNVMLQALAALLHIAETGAGIMFPRFFLIFDVHVEK